VSDLADNVIDEEGFIALVKMPEGLSLSEHNACLDQIVCMTAIEVKSRFMIMHKISQTYSQVSKEYIMPGFQIVDKMSTSEMFLSSSQVSARSRELSNYATHSTHSIRSVVLEVWFSSCRTAGSTG